MADDPLIKKTEEAAGDPDAEARFADLFDIRRIISGLFMLYGVVLFVLGLFASDEDIDRAAGVNVNLWGGLGLIIFALVFLAWALIRPLGRELAKTSQDSA